MGSASASRRPKASGPRFLRKASGSSPAGRTATRADTSASSKSVRPRPGGGGGWRAWGGGERLPRVQIRRLGVVEGTAAEGHRAILEVQDRKDQTVSEDIKMAVPARPGLDRPSPLP